MNSSFINFGARYSTILLPTLKGPCSVRKPKRELQPGPPFIHKTSGSVAGFLADSTNLQFKEIFTRILTLNAPITTKAVCFSRLLKCFRSLYGKQCGPRSDCSYSLLWVHAVCFYTKFISNVTQLFAADDFSRRHFQMHFFLGALRVKLRNDLHFIKC